MWTINPPTIPEVPNVQDQSLKEFLRATKENLDILAGRVGAEVLVWNTPVFQNGWNNYQGGTSEYSKAAYAKDSLGFVHLVGLISGGTVQDPLPAFTLPIGYRPRERMLYGIMANGVLGRIDVLIDGRVCPVTPTSNPWVQLNGIYFYAG